MVTLGTDLTGIAIPLYDYNFSTSLIQSNNTQPYLLTMLCSMDANGVTPIPAPIRTACSAWKMCVEGVP